MGDMLGVLLKELELRGECNLTRHSRTPLSKLCVDGTRKIGEPATANILLTAQQLNCAFCMGNQAHEDCKKVTNIKEQ